MKKLILAATALTAAASVFAQGTISFNSYVTGSKIHIYAPLASNSTLVQVGDSASDTPAGTTSWTGFTLIGAGSTSANPSGGYFGASTTMAELFAAQGLNQSFASLSPATSGGFTTFHTGAGGGITVATTATFDNIAQDYSAGVTTEMVVWDDSSGLYSTWALASAAWAAGTIAAAESGLMNITATIGGTSDTPPTFPAAGEQSFNLYYEVVPEPATFALAGLGLATLLVFRRRNS